jgi:prevent-host-death family protein
MEISVKEARAQFSSLLNKVMDGGEVIIRRRGKEIARLVPPPGGAGRRLPSLSNFRRSIRLKGDPLSAAVRKGRQEERF